MKALSSAARAALAAAAGVVAMNCRLVIDPIMQTSDPGLRDAQSIAVVMREASLEADSSAVVLSDAALAAVPDAASAPDARPAEALPEAPGCPTVPDVKVVACGAPLGSKLLAVGGGYAIWARLTNSQEYTELWRTALGDNRAVRLVSDPVGPYACDGRTLVWQGGPTSPNTVYALTMADLLATPKQQNFDSTGLRLSGGVGVGVQGILLAGRAAGGLRYGTLPLDLSSSIQLLEARPQDPFEVPYVFGGDMFGWALNSLGPGTFGRIPATGPTQVEQIEGQMRSTPVSFEGRVYYLRRVGTFAGLVLTSVAQSGPRAPQNAELSSFPAANVNTFQLAEGSRSRRTQCEKRRRKGWSGAG